MANPCRMRAEAARARLLELGSTQSALASELDVELRTLQRWLAGGHTTLANAEAVARALGLGTAELFDGVPSEGVSPFALLRGLGALLGTRTSPLVQATGTILEQFTFLDAYVSFAAHPRHGYVRRVPLDESRARGFARFRVRGPRRARHAFGAYVAPHLRYEFGEVVVADETASLVEHFHTRSMRARTRPDGAFDVDIWIPREMRELVVVSDVDTRVEPLSVVDRQAFDLRRTENEHALCFRPAPSHLREAGLAAHDDRVRGDRAARVDVA